MSDIVSKSSQKFIKYECSPVTILGGQNNLIRAQPRVKDRSSEDSSAERLRKVTGISSRGDKPLEAVRKSIRSNMISSSDKNHASYDPVVASKLRPEDDCIDVRPGSPLVDDTPANLEHKPSPGQIAYENKQQNGYHCGSQERRSYPNDYKDQLRGGSPHYSESKSPGTTKIFGNSREMKRPRIFPPVHQDFSYHRNPREKSYINSRHRKDHHRYYDKMHHPERNDVGSPRHFPYEKSPVWSRYNTDGYCHSNGYPYGHPYGAYQNRVYGEESPSSRSSKIWCCAHYPEHIPFSAPVYFLPLPHITVPDSPCAISMPFSQFFVPWRLPSGEHLADESCITTTYPLRPGAESFIYVNAPTYPVISPKQFGDTYGAVKFIDARTIKGEVVSSRDKFEERHRQHLRDRNIRSGRRRSHRRKSRTSESPSYSRSPSRSPTASHSRIRFRRSPRSRSRSYSSVSRSPSRSYATPSRSKGYSKLSCSRCYSPFSPLRSSTLLPDRSHALSISNISSESRSSVKQRHSRAHSTLSCSKDYNSSGISARPKNRSYTRSRSRTRIHPSRSKSRSESRLRAREDSRQIIPSSLPRSHSRSYFSKSDIHTPQRILAYTGSDKYTLPQSGSSYHLQYGLPPAENLPVFRQGSFLFQSIHPEVQPLSSKPVEEYPIERLPKLPSENYEIYPMNAQYLNQFNEGEQWLSQEDRRWYPTDFSETEKRKIPDYTSDSSHRKRQKRKQSREIVREMSQVSGYETNVAPTEDASYHSLRKTEEKRFVKYKRRVRRGNRYRRIKRNRNIRHSDELLMEQNRCRENY